MDSLGFIFDLDGTLIDSTPRYRQVWEDLLREHGSEYTAEVLLAYSARDAFRKILGGDYPDDLLEQHLARQSAMGRARMEADGLELHSGVRELIIGLRECGVRLGVATSARRANVEWPLKQLGL